MKIVVAWGNEERIDDLEKNMIVVLSIILRLIWRLDIEQLLKVQQVIGYSWQTMINFSRIRSYLKI